MIIRRTIYAFLIGVLFLPNAALGQGVFLSEDGQRACRERCPDFSDVACFKEKCADLFEKSEPEDEDNRIVVEKGDCPTRDAHELTLLNGPKGGGIRSYDDGQDGVIIRDGDRIIVPADYSVEILYEKDGERAIIDLEPETVFTLYCGGKAEMEKGFVDFIIDLVSGKSLIVETRNAIGGVRGTAFSVDARSASITKIIVRDGVVAVAPKSDPSKEAFVSAGSSANISGNEVSISDSIPEEKTGGSFSRVLIVSILGAIVSAFFLRHFIRT